MLAKRLISSLLVASFAVLVCGQQFLFAPPFPDSFSTDLRFTTSSFSFVGKMYQATSSKIRLDVDATIYGPAYTAYRFSNTTAGETFTISGTSCEKNNITIDRQSCDSPTNEGLMVVNDLLCNHWSTKCNTNDSVVVQDLYSTVNEGFPVYANITSAKLGYAAVTGTYDFRNFVIGSPDPSVFNLPSSCSGPLTDSDGDQIATQSQTSSRDPTTLDDEWASHREIIQRMFGLFQ